MMNVSRLLLVALFLFVGCDVGLAEGRQEHVHQRGPKVMPFDLNKTTHIFKMTVTGGIQRVIAKAPTDADQILLIQQHLQYEASGFRRAIIPIQPPCMAKICLDSRNWLRVPPRSLSPMRPPLSVRRSPSQPKICTC